MRSRVRIHGGTTKHVRACVVHKAWTDTVCVVKYAIFILQHFPLCGQMKDWRVESRLSRLVSEYKATSPSMSRDPCTACVQDRGQLCTETLRRAENVSLKASRKILNPLKYAFHFWDFLKY